MSVCVKNQQLQSSYRDDYMWNPSTYDYQYNKTCKIDEYLDIKNCLC